MASMLISNLIIIGKNTIVSSSKEMKYLPSENKNLVRLKYINNWGRMLEGCVFLSNVKEVRIMNVTVRDNA